jgi:hypothetical protein
MRPCRRNRLAPLWQGRTRALVLALGTALLAGTASAGTPDQVANICKPLSPPGSECTARIQPEEDHMAESVYKVIELVGTSSASWQKAAAAAVSRASKTLRDLGVRQ